MDKLEKIVSLCKRRGFIYPSFDIYGGLAGFYDYGPLGLALKNNIKQLWWKQFVSTRSDMFGIDSALVTKKEVLRASGHARGFADMLIECKKCKRRFRADHLEDKKKCSVCGGVLGEARQFYMMLETHIGALEDEASLAYLRPETAQGIFTNFKNIIDSFHPILPFGIAQIGKAFRNEIAPRDFLFRLREIEQMEVEYFIRPNAWHKAFEMWKQEILKFIRTVGIDEQNISQLEIAEENRAHYSQRTVDFEFDFPFGRKELYGLAYRADYDLKNHMDASGVDLRYHQGEESEPFIPHTIEPSLGVERTVLAVLLSAYTEDDPPAGGGEEKRVMLKLNPKIAPVKIAVFPLLANKPDLITKAKEVYKILQPTTYNLQAPIAWDDNGNIGKRYRRQDEIGTPWCVTIDFQTLDDNTVTIRDRDTGSQTRHSVAELDRYFSDMLLLL